MTSNHGSIFVGVFGILLILTMVLVAVAAFVF